MTGVGLENSHPCRTIQTDTLNFREVNLLRDLGIFTDRKHLNEFSYFFLVMMWWNGWRKRDFKDLSMSSLVGRCSSHVSWSFYRPRQLQTVTSKDVWCRCTPDNFLLVWRYEFKRLCNYSRNICLKCTVTLTYLLHKPKIQFWRQMTITLMVMDTFFSISYLLCLFCFFFCLVFLLFLEHQETS